MGRESFNDQRPSLCRKLHDLNSAIAFVPHPGDQPVPLEIVDHRRDIAAASEDFFTNLALREGSQVQKRFHHPKLALRDAVVLLEMWREPGLN